MFLIAHGLTRLCAKFSAEYMWNNKLNASCFKIPEIRELFVYLPDVF